MAMKDFKISGSQTSKIMGKTGLGETGESYIYEWLMAQSVGYRKEFSNRYTEKGIQCEDAGIDLVAEYYDLGLLIKNTERKSNDYCEGEADLVLKDYLRDIKCSWDVFTFPFFHKAPKNMVYVWQAQTYMYLWDKDKYFLDYCLITAPEHVITKEYWRKHYSLELKGDEVDEKLYDEVRSKMVFDNLPIERRIKTFEIKRDEVMISKIVDRVKDCRIFINNLK